MLVFTLCFISLFCIYLLRRVTRKSLLAKASHAKLASQLTPDGSHSCPDLSASQDDTPRGRSISQDHHTSFETASEQSSSVRQRPTSKRRRASSKVKRFFGRARDFRRVATGRMTDTARSSIVTHDHHAENGSSAGTASPQNSKEKHPLPAFLTLSRTGEFSVRPSGSLRSPTNPVGVDMLRKFEELEWLQRSRIASAVLANDPSHQWAIETTPEVRERTRYTSVQAWARSRIHLKVPEGECDFINASPIKLPDVETDEEVCFIATQVCH
jgi:protein-tyrosine phosphatase